MLEVFFKVNPHAGLPLYLQLIDQVRHAAEIGILEDGDQLPGIRTLAEQLVISPNTIAKAYSQLEQEGLLDLRHGSGAFVSIKPRRPSATDRIHHARKRLGALIKTLRNDGLRDGEIHRAFEAEFNHTTETLKTR